MSTSKHVCEQAGITYRQLDYWYRNGWLTMHRPVWAHSGIPHDWPVTMLRKAVLMGQLTRAGFAPVKAHEIAQRAIDAKDERFIYVQLGLDIILQVRT